MQAPSATDVARQLQADLAPAPLTELPGLKELQPNPARQLLDRLQGFGLRLALRLVGGGNRGAASGPAAGRQPAGGQATPIGRWLGYGLLAVVFLGILMALSSSHSTERSHLLPGILIGLIFFLRRLLGGSGLLGGGAAPARPAGAAGNQQARPSGPGRLQRWLNQQLDNLEQRRQAELRRLLQLFSENPAEALRYAIPLGGPYLNRGTAAPSGSLGRRDLRFDLGGLGGGQRVDGWDLGSFEGDLRRQYLAAAEQARASGQHQRAAYIQAHLLGDYRAAAQMLEQGGEYRLAAALYREHLRDQSAAAHCLETGGLLLEAADLYAGLGQVEKAGDLYQQLAQPGRAAPYFEQAAATFLGAQNHLEAARVLADKLAAPDRAAATLLQGWELGRQSEPCLQRYFDLAPDLPAQVPAVYRQHTPPPRRGALLRVLRDTITRHPAALPAAREVAYDIIGQETAAGPSANLQLLRYFEPADTLLPADLSRFASQQPRRPAAAAGNQVSVPTLDPTIAWHQAVAHGQQWLALGTREQQLHLARGNWHGQVEYYSWLVPLPAGTHSLLLLLLTDEQAGNRVLLRTPVPLALGTKTLPRNKYFAQALTVESPTWLPPLNTALALLPAGEVAAYTWQEYTLKLQTFTAAGRHQALRLYTPPASKLTGPDLAFPNELLLHQQTYYTYDGELLLTLLESGGCEAIPLGDSVFHLSRSPYAAELLLGVVTASEVLLWTPGRPGPPHCAATLPPELAGGATLGFVGLRHLVVFDNQHSALYRFERDQLQLLRVLPATHQLIAALPTSQQGQFVLLTANGRCTLHSAGE